MKNLLPVLGSVIIIISLFFFGCQKDSLLVQANGTYNSNVITNVPNAFSFVVTASIYNYSETHQLQINADTLAVAITITQYSTGSGSIAIKDSSNSVIYQKNLGSNMVVGDVIKITEIPKTVDLALNNYSGKITIAIAGK